MNLRRYRPVLIIAIASAAIVSVWFIGGYMLGAGESGIPFYNLDWHLAATSYAWKISMLGNQTSTTVAASPFLWLLSLFEPYIAPYLIQALVFFVSFFVSGLSIYTLSQELFPKLHEKYLYLAVLFYWFNPFTLVNVFNRFINNYIVAFALFPLVLTAYVFGVNRHKYKYALLVGISSVIFSFALTSVPFVMLMWLSIAIVTITNCLLSPRKEWPFLVSFFLLSLIVFVFMNYWWIGTLYSSTTEHNLDSILSSFFQTNNNYSAFKTLSQRLGSLGNLYRLTHGTFFTDTSLTWRLIFDNAFVRLIEYLGTGLILTTVYKKRKNRNVLLLAVLAIAGIFLAKGNSEPLGEAFGLVFVHVQALQVFRNAFEKTGLLVVVPFSVLFAYGSSVFLRGKRTLYAIYLILVIIFGFPFWTGLAVSGSVSRDSDEPRSYRTKIPKDYAELNTEIAKDPEDFRIITLPLDGEGISYNWAGGTYSGIELSSSIIEKPNLSMNTTIPYFDRSVEFIKQLFDTRYDFSKISSLLNAKYVLLRSDVDWQFRAMTDPNIVQDRISSLGYEQKMSSGDLALYSLPHEHFKPKVWVPDRTIRVDSRLDIKDYFVSEGNIGDAVYQGSIKLPNTYKQLVKPKWTNLLSVHPDYSVDESLATLSHVSHLPGSTLYPLLKYKEEIEVNENNDPDSVFINRLALLGKRAVEIYMTRDSVSDASSYFSELDNLKRKYSNQMYNSPTNKFHGLVSDSLYRHRSLFEKVEGSVFERLNDEMMQLGYLVKYFPDSPDANDGKFLVSSFDVNSPGIYTLLLEGQHWDRYFDIQNTQIYLNGKVVSIPIEVNSSGVVVRDIGLNKGEYEIAFSEPRQKNLVQSPDTVVLNSDGNGSWQADIQDFDPYSIYDVSFIYWVRRGKSFEYKIGFNNDAINDDGQLLIKSLADDGQIHEPRQFSEVVVPRLGATRMDLSFIARTSNNCKAVQLFFFDKCADPGYRRFFDASTLVEISDLNVHKIFSSDMYLLQDDNPDKFISPRITYEFVNPTRYLVHVEDASMPYPLVFSELFHVGWKVKVDGIELDESKHFFANGYANAWLIDKIGNYDLVIDYEPQSTLLKNQQISLIAFCIILGVFVFLNLTEK